MLWGISASVEVLAAKAWFENAGRGLFEQRRHSSYYLICAFVQLSQMSFPEHSWEIRVIPALCDFLTGTPAREDAVGIRWGSRILGYGKILYLGVLVNRRVLITQ